MRTLSEPLVGDHSYSSKMKSETKKKDIEKKRSGTHSNAAITLLRPPSDYMFLTLQESLQLQSVVLSTRNIEKISNAILKIPTMRENIVHQICSEMGERPLKMQNKKHGFISVLHPKDFESMESVNFGEIIREMGDKFPELSSACLSIMLPPHQRASVTAVAEIVPKLCLIYSILLQTRCHELSRLQRVISMCLTDNICDQPVSVYLILNNSKTYFLASRDKYLSRELMS